jgi:hypothetical protein
MKISLVVQRMLRYERTIIGRKRLESNRSQDL